MNLRTLKVAIAAAVLPAFAHAGVTVSGMATHQYYDNIFYDKTLPQVGLGYRFDHGPLQNFALELVYGQTKVDIGRSANNRFGNSTAPNNTPYAEADIKQYRVDAKYFLPILSNSALEPYLAAGAGQMFVKGCEAGSIEAANNCKEDVFQYNAGGGVQYAFTENLKTFLDARYLGWQLDGAKIGDKQTKNNVDDVQVSLGITYDFGGKAPMPAAPVSIPPRPEPVKPKRVDSDGDGVYDDMDKCPNTPRGYAVDAQGCKVAESVLKQTNLRILFDTNKALIKPMYMNEVAQVANFMKQFPESKTVIEGHTDSRGAAKYNQKLSQRRADAVRDTLVNKYGVSAERVRSVGYGEDRPVASNATEAGRAANRRVTATVRGQKRVYKRR